MMRRRFVFSHASAQICLTVCCYVTDQESTTAYTYCACIAFYSQLHLHIECNIAASSLNSLRLLHFSVAFLKWVRTHSILITFGHWSLSSTTRSLDFASLVPGQCFQLPGYCPNRLPQRDFRLRLIRTKLLTLPQPVLVVPRVSWEQVATHSGIPVTCHFPLPFWCMSRLDSHAS